MAITSGFFDSISGDRTYNADQMSTYFEGLVSDGIYENIGDRFIVQAASGMNVTIGTGRALIKSHWIKNDAAVTLTLDAADLQLSRIDAIVLQLDLTESGRDIDIIIKKGTPSASPTKPSITRTNTIYELCLAYISVNKNTTAITQNNISDQRSSSLCGWVTGIIKQVDTSDLFLQWQTAYETYYEQSTTAFDSYLAAKKTEFENWFDSLTRTLNVDTTITKYQNTVTVSGTTSEVAIGISQYDSSTDVLFVYVNGILLNEVDEFTVSSGKITLKNALQGTNIVTFIVIKNTIGKSVVVAGEMINVINAATDSIAGHLESAGGD